MFIKKVQTLLSVSGILGFLCLGCVHPHFLQDYSFFSDISLPFLPVNSISLCFESLFRFYLGIGRRFDRWGLVAGGCGFPELWQQKVPVSESFLFFTFNTYTLIVNNIVWQAGRTVDLWCPSPFSFRDQQLERDFRTGLKTAHSLWRHGVPLCVGLASSVVSDWLLKMVFYLPKLPLLFQNNTFLGIF